MNQTKVIAIANQKVSTVRKTINPSLQIDGILMTMVRRKENERYELISGHRRCRACALAGLTTLKCEVRELTHDEAVIIMAERNMQLPRRLFLN